MIDSVSRAAFADELTKIAGVNWAPAKTILREGLIGSPSQGLLGRGLGIAGTALQARQGLKSSLAKEDPTGQNRSRIERTTRFGGDMLGGILGSGFASHAINLRSAARVAAGGKPIGMFGNLLGSVAGGIAGSIAGGQVAKAPFALKRKLFGGQQMAPQQQPQQNPAPGGVHSPDAITGQAQAM